MYLPTYLSPYGGFGSGASKEKQGVPDYEGEDLTIISWTCRSRKGFKVLG